MRIFKSHPLLSLVNGHLVDSPQPSNISYLWNFGSLLGFCLVIQIITGVTLAMHYNPSVLEAFNSVEHIMRDVNNGWLIRYLHSNIVSAFFFLVYLHIGRGLYRNPKTLVWTIGTVIFILMMATAFLEYMLPYGQMSLWGATITNLVSAIPWVKQDIVEFIWGGFSVNNATLNRFFALHFVLPFLLAVLALMHLIALHDSAGWGNPLGISSKCDGVPFTPYFTIEGLIWMALFVIFKSFAIFIVSFIISFGVPEVFYFILDSFHLPNSDTVMLSLLPLPEFDPDWNMARSMIESDRRRALDIAVHIANNGGVRTFSPLFMMYRRWNNDLGAFVWTGRIMPLIAQDDDIRGELDHHVGRHICPYNNTYAKVLYHSEVIS